MTLAIWLSFVVVCLLGTMSPGPSLAVVLRQTLGNGRKHGVITAVSHSTGVAVWAILTLWGLGVVVSEHPMLYQVITYVGALYLAWLGLKAIRSKGNANFGKDKAVGPYSEAVRDGVIISVLNPKLALFFIALFSQFVSADQSVTEKLIYMGTVVCIDMLWLCSVAVVLSKEKVIKALQKKAKEIDQVSGLVMIGLALRIAL